MALIHESLYKSDNLKSINIHEYMTALTANLASVFILIKFRDGDSNVRSVWICSRNDAIGNIAVLIAAWGVWETDSELPDLLVALFMASLFLYGATQIIQQARGEIASVTPSAESARAH